MTGLMLRPPRRGRSDPWNWAIALPATLTVCLASYACYSLLGTRPNDPVAAVTPPVEAVISTSSLQYAEAKPQSALTSAALGPIIAPEETGPLLGLETERSECLATR